MTTSLLRLLVCLGSATLLLHTVSAASPRKAFGYSFPEGETNVYRVEIEAQAEAGTEAVTGLLFLWTKPSTNDFQTLAYRVQFSIKPGGAARPIYYSPMYQPGGNIPLFSLLTVGVHPSAAREAMIDSRGVAVRTSSDQVLPVPLGTVLSTLIPEIPATPARQWEVRKTAYVMDEPTLLGPAQVFTGGYPGSGYMPRPFTPERSGPGAVAVSSEAKYSLEEGADQLTLSADLGLSSILKTGDQPLIKASAKVRWILAAGSLVPKRAEWNCESALVTRHVSRRTTLKLTAERLEGEALTKALQPPPVVRPEDQILSGEAAAKLVEQMESSDQMNRIRAAQELSTKTVKELASASLDKLAQMVNDSDTMVRRAALKVIAAHPRAADLPILVRAATDDDFSIRQEAVRGIGAIKTEQAAVALAELLAAGVGEQVYAGKNSDVVDALKKIGPAAEPAVLPLLKGKNMQTLVFACTVLEAVGTQESMSSLKELVGHQSKNVSEAAAAACRAIQGR